MNLNQNFHNSNDLNISNSSEKELNDILKSDFFGIKNKDNIIKACSYYKIKKKLVKNIEAEYMQNLKIKEEII